VTTEETTKFETTPSSSGCRNAEHETAGTPAARREEAGHGARAQECRRSERQQSRVIWAALAMWLTSLTDVPAYRTIASISPAELCDD
jgi:hypothetical protein